jgi:glycosyltransferase involved in cell wall biosynthesis
MKPKVHIASQCVVQKDAIGTDVVQMATALTQAGYDTDIFAAGIDPCYASSVKPVSTARADYWRSSDILVYHHSGGWPDGEALVDTARHCRVVIRYHNVTPPEFFVGISEPHVTACRDGQELTRRLANLPYANFWAASTFNAEQLIAYGAPRERLSVLPPLHAIESLRKEPFDYGISGEYRARGPYILFVGGFKPNKGHERAIRLFHRYYHDVNRSSRLVFAGNVSPAFERYTDGLRAIIHDLQLDGAVLFTASANASRLRTLYLLADVFLCVSDHEGFCVPLVEAMFFRVPIVARAVTAVGETLGRCGLVWDDFNEDAFVESIDRVVENSGLAYECRRLGRERYRSEYAPDVLKSRLFALVEGVSEPRSRRRPASAVTSVRG